MAYHPFSRGPFPVGVETLSMTDPTRSDRRLPVELWYPAVDSSAGLDLRRDSQDGYSAGPGLPVARQAAVRGAVARLGSFPIVLFSHGLAGHRRQSSFLCTHWASHGFVVAAMDHVGNTTADLLPGARTGVLDLSLRDTMQHRPLDVSFVLDELGAGRGGAGAVHGDRSRVAVSGHSLGGWTSLAAAGRDGRIAVAMPLAPAGGDWPGMLEAIDFGWERLVPTLVVGAGRDFLLSPEGTRRLFARIQAPKKLLVLADADHLHFCDATRQIHQLFRALPFDDGPIRPRHPIPPIETLADPKVVHEILRGVTVAHLDAHLRDLDEAKDFLASELTASAGTRGLVAELG